ncbi:hypothetical protein SI65_02608 [Aspergillus cristatus]|uniref:AHC1-like C2H2 zinc-finger domain-containing protein n=1 Tax=Aspergillus cristatus TaxID=573508 RepID=A0A1E3BLD6_ASPCR|nr:hypothetical protein SI65_02608 [Aspergillus cristatus]
MFRLLPWPSVLGGDITNHTIPNKHNNNNNDSHNITDHNNHSLSMLATPPSCASHGVPLQNSLPLSSFKSNSQLKRKRSPSPDAPDTPAPTKLCFGRDPSANSNNAPVAPLSPSSQSSVSQSAKQLHHQPSSPVASHTKSVNVDKLRETLEAQLSLEVLLKHNELRLIDQELAKCQVALEQMRRCSEIPYPGSQVAGLSPSLANGTGMAVCPPGNGPVPSSPAPWGITDGPYSRHYARWLLPDPRFGGGHIDAGTPWGAASSMPGANTIGTTPFEGRSTRGTSGDYAALTKSRPQRGSASGAKLQALSNGCPPVRERAGPMIIRRKSDGVMVKLVCLDCRRDNFSSTQGFINHCRIAHNRNFASHDAAAVASGEPVEVDEAGAVVGESKTETSSGPAAAPGYVHPLVRSAHVIESSQSSAITPATATAAAQNAATPRKRFESTRLPSSSMVETPRNAHIRSLSEGNRRTPGMVNQASSSFLASPITPHLSSLMQHQGIGVDLGQLVDEAKATIDLEAYSSGDENDEGSEDENPVPPPSSTDLNAGMSEARGGRQPMRTVGASQQPSTSRDARKPQPLETLTPVRPGASYIPSYGSTPSSTMEDNVDGMDLTVNLSPHTVESNQAPSLVSDDDDDGDARSDSTGSPGPSSSEAEDDDGQDFSHINVEGDDETTSSTTAAATEPKSGPPSLANPAPTAAPLPKSLRRGSHPRSQNKKKKNDRFISSSTALDSGNNKEEKRVSFVSPQLSPDSSPSKGKDGHGRK